MEYTSEMTVELIQQMGSDAMIVAAARVSTRGALAKVKADPQGGEGLIRYLMKHRHGSPFEHGAMTFYIHAPVFVWREFHRHRIGFSFSEESARFKTLEPVFFVPSDARGMFKVDSWKPSRPKFTPISTDAEREHYDELCVNLKESYELAYRKYEENLSIGIDPGLARDCLPVGVYSSCWVTCNPRSLMSFLSLRTHEATATFVSYPLAEIEDVARKMEAIFSAHWPITHAEFCNNGRVGP